MPKDKARDLDVNGDTLDRFMAEWSGQRPDLDFDYLATIGRILRVSAHLRETMDEWLAPFGLTWEMFDLLASLQRSGAKTGLRPTDLYEACMLSSGAMTNRLDRLAARGLVERYPDPADRRGVIVRLTPEGKAAVDGAFEALLDAERALLSGLPPRDQVRLATLLRTLLAPFSDAEPG